MCRVGSWALEKVQSQREPQGKVVGSYRDQGVYVLNKGTVMRKLLGPGGSLEGKPVEKASVAKLVDAALGAT